MNKKERRGLMLRILTIPLAFSLFSTPALFLDISNELKIILLLLAWIVSFACGFLAIRYQKPLFVRDLEKIRKKKVIK